MFTAWKANAPYLKTAMALTKKLIHVESYIWNKQFQTILPRLTNSPKWKFIQMKIAEKHEYIFYLTKTKKAF